MKQPIKKISIIGDGGWGTTLAVYLSRKGYSVILWGAFSDNIELIRKSHVNEKFLPGIRIPDNVIVTNDLGEAIQQGRLIIVAVPSKYIVAVLRRIRRYPLSKKIFLSVIKGIDCSSLLRMSQIISRELGPINLAVLSGPTIALEIARGIPSTAVIASRNMQTAIILQKIFNSESFRVYTNKDLTGLELGGSLKNIIAIACGVCDGLGFGTNAKAAILTRGLLEMSRLGKALGAKVSTFSGLAGLGDLVTTCISPQSRNRYVGEQLGKGKSISEIIASMDMVAEGVDTVKAVYKLSHKLKVSMPITTEVFKIIYHNKKPRQAVKDLMGREMKAE